MAKLGRTPTALVSLSAIATFALAHACGADRSSFDDSFGPNGRLGNGTESLGDGGGAGGGGDGPVTTCEAAAGAKGSLGCNFLASTPGFMTTPNGSQGCFAAFVANGGTKPAKLTLKRTGQTFDIASVARMPDGSANVSSWPSVPADGLPVGGVAVLFLSHFNPGASTSISCPIQPALTINTILSDSARGNAFELGSDVPITAYDILPYGGSASYLPSAELLLPTTAWGTNYVAVTPPNEGNNALSYLWLQVVASEPTTVQVTPRAQLRGGTNLSPAATNTKTTYTLGAGEYVQFRADGDPSGTVISSDKPVAVMGGNAYACFKSQTSQGGGCDSAHQLVPSVNALGSEYAVAPYQTRRADNQNESIKHRLAGIVDGTVLTFEPPVSGAPSSVSQGQVFDFETSGGFVVKSQDAQHPFYVGQSMSGCQVASGSRPGAVNLVVGGPPCLGDEEYVVTLPAGQFRSNYAFFTDPTYGTTSLAVTRKKGPAGFSDVKLGCSGTISGWTPLGTSGIYEVAHVDLLRAGQQVNNCKNGAQSATSDGPFGITVWGLDHFASYAYPAGGNATALNEVVVSSDPK